MKESIRSAYKALQQYYIDCYYLLRKSLQWKKVDAVYLNICDSLITKKIFGGIIRGDYEIDENKMLKKTFTKDDVLVELGTGLGFNSIYCAKVNNNKVVTFEGNPGLIPLIRKNMEKNKVQFELRNEIVLSHDSDSKDCVFHVVEDFWSSSLKSNPSSKIISEVKVPSCHIKEVISYFKPTYLMVDIEGGEDEFFNDCSFLENSSIKKILIELHADVLGEEKCFGVMKKITEKGFKMKLDGGPKNVVYFFKEEVKTDSGTSAPIYSQDRIAMQ